MHTTKIVTLNLVLVLSLILITGPIKVSANPLTFSCSNVTEIPQNQCEALVALYNSTGGENWNNNSNWLVTNTPSNWYGVVVMFGQVISLNLGENYLNGSVPAEIGNITTLEGLHLYGNQLSGNIPTELGNLSNLFVMRLHNNPLVGSIPLSFINLTRLDIFYFYGTSLCEPNTTEYIAWKATFYDYQGTDVNCQVHVCDLDGTAIKISRPKWSATVSITIFDISENPVFGAVVTGNWSDGSSDTCITNIYGSCEITLGNLTNKTKSVSFSVTDVFVSAYTYVPSANYDLDGDSDGTTIEINKPK